MAPTNNLPPSFLDNTIGTILLGVIGSALLSGTTFVQAYLYYCRYPHDKLLNKIAVMALWLLDIVHLASLIHAGYFFLITEYGNLEALNIIPWSLKLHATINLIVILIVHSLYVQRIWILSGYHRGVLGYVVIILVSAGAAVGLNSVYVIIKCTTFKELKTASLVVNVALGLSTGINFTIAASLCYYLFKSKGNATSLNSRISRIIQYTIGTGLFTSAASLADMLVYIFLPTTFIFVSLGFLMTKLYIASFLAMLNSRTRTKPKTTGIPDSPTLFAKALIMTDHTESIVHPKSHFSNDVSRPRSKPSVLNLRPPYP